MTILSKIHGWMYHLKRKSYYNWGALSFWSIYFSKKWHWALKGKSQQNKKRWSLHQVTQAITSLGEHLPSLKCRAQNRGQDSVIPGGHLLTVLSLPPTPHAFCCSMISSGHSLTAARTHYNMKLRSRAMISLNWKKQLPKRHPRCSWKDCTALYFFTKKTWKMWCPCVSAWTPFLQH